jgi:nicotinamide-nucleotide amidase
MTPADTPAVVELAEQVAIALRRLNSTVAAAESVTGGQIACRLSAADGASDWFRGGLVAYSEYAKVSVLGVDPGPVITRACAEQMAAGVQKLLSADYAVSTTGAGGPGPAEDQPAGTVFIAVASPGGCHVHDYHFDGDPEDVVRGAAVQALRDLVAVTCESAGTQPSSGDYGR